ncbi:MAG TPA: redox-sensing transcriptional repressor Rex [Deinococcales bacterium]|nr:redox-sensing transcriptional repressor Rex [Deinococcales bacterium]
MPPLKSRKPAKDETHVPIPSATVSRMVTYLRILTKLENEGVNRTSSEVLAEQARVSAFQVRKDLAYFGRFGVRGMGYTVLTLRRELEYILGVNDTRAWNVGLVGMGRLGQAIAAFPGVSSGYFNLVALFDEDPNKVGQTFASLPVSPMTDLATVAARTRMNMAIICVPAEAAQRVADQLCQPSVGVKGILNFAPTTLVTPDSVIVEPVDVLAGMKRLAFYILNPHLKDTKEEKR